MLDKVLLVSGAPVNPARLERVLYGSLHEIAAILAVPANSDPLQAIENALRFFEPTRIVVAGSDPRTDVTGDIEDRFGRVVMAIPPSGASPVQRVGGTSTAAPGSGTAPPDS